MSNGAGTIKGMAVKEVANGEGLMSSFHDLIMSKRPLEVEFVNWPQRFSSGIVDFQLLFFPHFFSKVDKLKK